MIASKRKSLDKVVVQADQFEVENMISTDFRNKASYISSQMKISEQIRNGFHFDKKRSANSSLSFLNSITSS
jgi:hypothetical protein